MKDEYEDYFVAKEKAGRVNERLAKAQARVQDRIDARLSKMQQKIYRKTGEFFDPESYVPSPPLPHGRRRKGERGSSAGAGQELSEGKQKFFARVKSVLVRKLDRMKTGFRIHATVFGIINGFLCALNLLTSPSFPWFLFPMGGWGIAVLIHYGAYRMQKRKTDEICRFETLSPEQLHTLEKYMASKSAFGIHFYVSLAVSGFLAMVNLITGIIPPWCLIPITALAVPLAIHGGVQSAIQSSLRDRLKRMLRGARQTEAYEEEAGPPEYLEALKLKAKIIKQVETSGPGQKELISELMPVLEQYMEAIKVLGIQSRKYSALLDSINVEEWQEEKKELEARLETAKTPGLKKEYTQVLEHLNKQIKSVDSLAEKEELVQVRIRSSLSSLKKMQMDLVLREDVATHMAVLKETRTRLEELQQYTEDLEEGFRELDDEF